MTSNKCRTNRLPKTSSSLDLHGCSKSEALSRTTDFLERSNSSRNSKNSWVLIITGSGAHSMDGPVLRGAVERLLLKRKIEYYPMIGRGSFLVNAATGITLYERPQPIDSKVCVTSNLPSIHRTGNSRERELSESKKKTKILKNKFHKLRKENAAFDKAISKSLEENMRRGEDDELSCRAMNLSLLEKREEKEEEQNLCAAIEISKQELCNRNIDDDDQLRKILAVSKLEFDYQNNPDACIQRAIELSEKEEDQLQHNKPIEGFASKHDEDQEDEEFLKALEMSIEEF